MVTQSSFVYDLPEQKTSREAKLSPDFYRATYNNIINRALAQNDKTKIRAWLEASNGIISNDTLNYLSTPFIDAKTKEAVGKLPGEIRETDLINTVRERNLGEYIGLPYKFEVGVHDAEAVTLKDAKIKQEVDKYIQQAVINEMNRIYEERAAQGEDALNLQAPSEDLPDLTDFINKKIEEYFDERAIKGQALLELINDNNNFDVRRLQLYYWWWACEEFYTFREIVGRDLKVDAVSPLEGYPIIGKAQFIEDAEAFIIRRPIFLSEVKARFWNKMTKAEQDYVKSLTKKNGAYFSSPEWLKSRTSLGVEKGSYFSNPYSEYRVTQDNDLLYENIIIWRTEVPVKVKTYIDNLGEEFEEIVDDDYIPQEGETLREEWIEECWMGRRFGEATVGVYLAPEPVSVQRYDENTNRCKLPVGGKKGILLDVVQNPIPKRLINYELIDRIYGLQIERTIAKFQPYINIIPQSVINDDISGTSTQKMFMIKADNTIIYDDQQVDINVVLQGLRSVQMGSIADYIRILYDLKKSYREEGLQMANMNSYRLGDVNPSMGKGVLQESIYRAAVGNVLSITMFNAALERDHNADLEFAKVAFATGVKNSFYSRAEKKTRFIDISSEEILETRYGVFVHNAKTDQAKIDAYMNFAFSAAQNGDFELAAAAIESDTLPEIRSAVKKIVEANRKLEEELSKQQTDATYYAADKAAETKEREIASSEQIAYNHDNALVTVAQINAQSNESNVNTSQPVPFNSNVDNIVKSFQKDREIYMKKQMHDDVMKDKREQRKSDEKIAKMNKN